MALGGAAAIAALVAVGGGMIWLVRWNRRRGQEAAFDRKVRARKLGWHVNETPGERIDYRFAGASGSIAWTMWHDSDRGDESPTPTACWLSENLRTARLSLVILGRRRYRLESGMVGRLVMGVASGVASAVNGGDGTPDKSSFYESAVPVGGGTPSFSERFTIAVAPDMPRDWIDDDLRRLLLQWPAGESAFRADDTLEINLGPRGLSIVVRKMPEDMACWQHLAAIGETIAAKLAAASR